MTHEELYNKIVTILQKHKTKQIAIFGSYAQNQEQPESDIDVLVEFKDQKSLLELVAIETELSEALGIKIDLLTEKSVSPYLIEGIKAKMKVVYP